MAVAQLASFRMDADLTPVLRKEPGRTRRDFQAPDQLRVEVVYPSGTELRLLDGEAGWRGGPGRLRPAEGPALAAMRYQLLRTSAPWSLLQHRARLKLLPRRDWGGRTVRPLVLPWSQELVVLFLVDEGSQRIIGVEARVAMGETWLEFMTVYRDFREVEGLLVPHSEQNWASGRHTATTTVRSITFAPSDLGPFRPPTAPHR